MLKRYKIFLITVAVVVAMLLILKRECLKMDNPGPSRSPDICFELIAEFQLVGKQATSSVLSPVRECRGDEAGTTPHSIWARLCP